MTNCNVHFIFIANLKPIRNLLNPFYSFVVILSHFEGLIIKYFENSVNFFFSFIMLLLISNMLYP